MRSTSVARRGHLARTPSAVGGGTSVSFVEATRPWAASAYPSNPVPMRAGRASGPRWIHVLSTSIDPPASPDSDHLRPAASDEKLLPHVTTSTADSSRNGLATSMRTERRTQRCRGAPHPVSSTSSVARAGRKRATASRRNRPWASVSDRRIRYLVRKVRPDRGRGTRASTAETLRQLENHPLVARRERDVPEPFIETLRRIVGVDAQRYSCEALLPGVRMDRIHEHAPDAPATLAVHHGDGQLGGLVVDVSLAMSVGGEEPVPHESEQLAIVLGDERRVPRTPPVLMERLDLVVLEYRLAGWELDVGTPSDDGRVHHLANERCLVRAELTYLHGP